ncbi:MAG: tRNA (5-methylaminomethyl-2-thiouridine)(34)-methyltransferase MnmD [Prevotellaceae bacterium]|nr:tRNA (5-methylaminomethyl-2-thiouridine)(34)-methyltransferase MnmD [Prevotellaceae bacterium]
MRKRIIDFVKFVLTADGSHSLFVSELGERYHSINGAIQESRHIFIGNALNQIQKNDIRVLEIGFGTGLNAFLTLLETGKRIHYTTIELYPLPVETACALNYPERLNAARRADFEHLHFAEWNREVAILPNFTLYKIYADFTQQEFPGQYDVIYFDAFSPEKQPEMWSESVFEKLYNAAAPDAVMTTYCAKGAVRRAMQQAGFTVERLPGPPGKREMLRAVKMQ